MFKKIFSLLLLGISLLIPTYLPATNAILGFGVGPRNRAMGGANGAAPVDISTILVNPAGLTWLPTSCDMGASIACGNYSFDTRKATGLAVNPEAGYQHGILKYFVFPFTGAVYNPECTRFSFGFSLLGIGGANATYKKPRTNPALLLEPNGVQTVAETGAIYDTSDAAQFLQGGLAMAYQFTDKLSFGATLDANVAAFSFDLAVNTPAGLMQTNGRGRLDICYGVGFTLGILYQINEQLAAGVTYVSPQWFEKSKLYNDLIPNFRLPPQVRLGFAYRPYCPLLLTLDLKWIGWKTISLFGKKPTKGGVGWHDQYTIGVGLEYSFNSSCTFRAGYNYGKAQIRSNVVFANIFIPAYFEHHFGLGLEYQLNEHNSIAICGTYNPKRTVKDNGKGDLVSQLGKGIKSSGENRDITFAWTLKF